MTTKTTANAILNRFSDRLPCDPKQLARRQRGVREFGLVPSDKQGTTKNATPLTAKNEAALIAGTFVQSSPNIGQDAAALLDFKFREDGVSNWGRCGRDIIALRNELFPHRETLGDILETALSNEDAQFSVLWRICVRHDKPLAFIEWNGMCAVDGPLFPGQQVLSAYTGSDYLTGDLFAAASRDDTYGNIFEQAGSGQVFQMSGYSLNALLRDFYYEKQKAHRANGEPSFEFSNDRAAKNSISYEQTNARPVVDQPTNRTARHAPPDTGSSGATLTA